MLQSGDTWVPNGPCWWPTDVHLGAKGGVGNTWPHGLPFGQPTIPHMPPTIYAQAQVGGPCNPQVAPCPGPQPGYGQAHGGWVLCNPTNHTKQQHIQRAPFWPTGAYGAQVAVAGHTLGRGGGWAPQWWWPLGWWWPLAVITDGDH